MHGNEQDTLIASLCRGQIGYAQSRLGDYTAAEAALKQYIALRPGSPNPTLHAFDSATVLVGKCQAMVDVSRNPAEERALESVRALLELEQGRNDQALAHFAKADPESAYDLFYTALAQERKGDKVEAARFYARVATWNQNDLGHALVRARALAKKS